MEGRGGDGGGEEDCGQYSFVHGGSGGKVYLLIDKIEINWQILGLVCFFIQSVWLE